MVLSGMSDMSQLEENTAFMAAPAPLTGEERALLAQVAELLSALPAIPCTACRYCVDDCPQRIPIPEYFALYNADQPALRQGRPANREAYAGLAGSGGKASDCVVCRRCEELCPQHPAQRLLPGPGQQARPAPHLDPVLLPVHRLDLVRRRQIGPVQPDEPVPQLPLQLV